MVRLEPWSTLSAPSTSQRLEVVEPPLTEMSEPPASPLLTMFMPSWAVTPGWSRVSCMKLRPFSGSSRTCSPLTTPAISAPTVLTARALASTLTVSATSPVESCMSTARTSATLTTTPLLTDDLNPENVTSIR